MKLRKQLPFLIGTTKMAQLMRHHDWSTSSLGQPLQWPLSLRSVVNLLLGSAFPMFVAWGPDLALLYNDSYAELLGEKHPSALGMPSMDVWREADTDLEPLVQRALNGESFYMENLSLRLHRHGYDEDAWFTFSYSPVLDDAGMTAGFYCVCVETTAMVQAGRQTRMQQQRLQTLFQQTPGFTAVLRGPDHVFEIANQAFLQLTGFRDVLGKPVAEALPEVIGQGFIELLNQVRETRVPFVGRSTRIMLRRERDAPLCEAFLNFVYQPITEASGQVEGIFVQGYDTTLEHQAQQALLVFSNSIPAIAWIASPDGAMEHFNSQWTRYTGQREADALNAGWIAALHPDEANAAWQAARAMNSEWQGEHRLRRHDGIYHWFLTRAVPQMDAKGGVLRWFGTMTDIEDNRRAADALRNAGRQKDEFLATLIESAVQAARPGLDAKGHTLKVTLPENALWVKADQVWLAQVLSNLLNNAANYTDAGGSICLDVKLDTSWLVFAVTDNGIGLSPAAIQNVFVMFTQEQSALDRSEGGLGIGLALSKGLIELHGGTISAYSEGPGRGSRFEFRLPYGTAIADPDTTLADAEPLRKPVRTITVLLADDNRDSAETLAELLRLDGHVVYTAHDGIQATALAMQLKPDVIVLDIGMPGLNGYEVAQRIRAQPWGDHPLLVAATGWGQDDDRKNARISGFDLHLIKPFDPQELINLIADRAKALKSS